MNSIKQRKASLESPNTTHTHSPLHNEEIEAASIASAQMGRGRNGGRCMICPIMREAGDD
jgi:arginine deiminase